MKPTSRLKQILASFLLMLAAASATSAAAPAIQITSPAPGTTFNTGQTINVTVDVTAPGAFKTFALIGSGELGAAQPQPAGTTPPSFALPIPANLQPGSYSITALGYGPNSSIVAQSRVLIQIENPSALINLITPSDTLTFEAIGERLPLQIQGTANGGAPIDLSQSPQASFTSSNLTVGAVDSTGMVTAMGPGSTNINVSLAGGGNAAIPIHVLPPAIVPSARSIALGDQPMGATGASTSFTVTNMLSYPLNIISVQASPGILLSDECVSSSPIPAGNSCTVGLNFQPLAQGVYTGFVSISNSAVIAPTRVALSGLGTPSPGASAIIKPRKLDFGTVHPDHSSEASFTIRNTGSASLNVYIASASVGSFSVINRTGLFTVAAGHKHDVALTFSPTEPPARKGAVTRVSATLNLTTNDPLHPSFLIMLTGKVK
jgi:hypothetical protein